MDPPTSPRAGQSGPKHRTRPSEQLHYRSMSTSTRIVIPPEPHTPPRESRRGAGAHAGHQYRAVPDSPSVRQGAGGGATRAPVPNTPTRRRKVSSGRSRSYTQGSAHDWVEERGTRGSSVRRLLTWTAVAAAVLVLVAIHQTGRSDGGSEEVEELQKVPVVDEYSLAAKMKAQVRPHKDRPVQKKPIYRPDHLPRPAIAHDESLVAGEDVVPSKSMPNRYLLVAWMGEQETKAQSHLYQLGLLAIALNRTLVLPQVRRSRFGTCYHNDFSLYYAPDSLDAFSIPYVTHGDFLTWTMSTLHKPTAQLVAMIRGPPVPDDVAFMPLNSFCLQDIRMSLDEYPPRAFTTMEAKPDEARFAYGEQVAQTLLDDDADDIENRGGADVLVFQFNMRYPFLKPESVVAPGQPVPAPYSYFAYSSHWTALGASLAASLKPYVAVHWRTETLPTSLLAPCGIAMIRRLRKVVRQHPAIDLVYLATDYPIEALGLETGLGKPSGDAHSGTMNKVLTPEHHQAMRGFIHAFHEEFGTSLRLTSFLGEQERGGIPMPEELRRLLPGGQHGAQGLQISDLDPAIVGIVDKIVLQQAQVFIAGSTGASSRSSQCAKSSQFTTQVITGRQEVFAAQAQREGAAGGAEAAGDALWNDVGHFSFDGSDED